MSSDAYDPRADPWCPELATGVCVVCGKPCDGDWLACKRCIDVGETQAGKGTALACRVIKVREDAREARTLGRTV